MEDFQKYLDPRTLAKLQGLELRARLIVEGYVSGVHRSPYHGFSIEFAEHREYVPGDDLRYVDWKVFGKTDKYYLKQYEEETNLICYLLLDTSQSMSYRGPDAAMSKLEYAQCVAASLAYLVLQQQDSVGLVTFDDEVRALVRPGSNPSHLKQLLHVMEVAVGRAKDGDRADLSRSGRAAQKARDRRDLERPVRRRAVDDGRAEALSASAARGDHLSRARSGRTRFSVPADDALQGSRAICPTCSPSRARYAGPIWSNSSGSSAKSNKAAANTVSIMSPCAPTSRSTLRSRPT